MKCLAYIFMASVCKSLAVGVVGNISTITSTNGYFTSVTNTTGDVTLNFVLTNIGSATISGGWPTQWPLSAITNAGTAAASNVGDFDSSGAAVAVTNNGSLLRTNGNGYGLTGLVYTALPWTPPTNTPSGITFALQYTTPTNTYAALTNVFGFKPATNNQNAFTGIITNLTSTTVSNRTWFSQGVITNKTQP